MTIPGTLHSDQIARTMPHAHEWEMISAFGLSLPKDRIATNECLIEPVAAALQPLGIEEKQLCEISKSVEQAGEELRSNCLEGKLDCINVRVHVSSQGLRSPASRQGNWSYFVIKQIASSESDSLESIEDPRCFIDLHVY